MKLTHILGLALVLATASAGVQQVSAHESTDFGAPYNISQEGILNDPILLTSCPMVDGDYLVVEVDSVCPFQEGEYLVVVEYSFVSQYDAHVSGSFRPPDGSMQKHVSLLHDY